MDLLKGGLVKEDGNRLGGCVVRFMVLFLDGFGRWGERGVWGKVY